MGDIERALSLYFGVLHGAFGSSHSNRDLFDSLLSRNSVELKTIWTVHGNLCKLCGEIMKRRNNGG